MDDDDDREYDPANNFSGYNTDDDDNENDIDSDLEEKLYAAVFHSNDISSKSQESAFDNITSLSDVVNSWKNITNQRIRGDFLSPDKVCASRQLVEKLSPDSLRSSEEKSECFNSGGKKPSKISHEGLDSDDDIRRDKRGDAFGRENPVDASCRPDGGPKCSENTETSYVLADREETIDLRREEGTAFGKETVQNQPEKLSSSGDKSSDKYIMKKQKNSPRTSTKSKDSRGDYRSPRKSQRANDCERDAADAQAENDSRNNSAAPSAPEDATVSSEVKAEEELDRNESIEKREGRLPLPGNEACRAEEGADGSPGIKPEEDSATIQSPAPQVADKTLEEADVKPEEVENAERGKEEGEKATCLETSASSSDSSDSSSTENSSSSSEQETRRTQNKASPDPGEWEEVITLEDSEGSIYEVPVPPKPRPPTINLDDSDNESSSSYDSDASTEILSPKELVQSYKLAVSESGANATQQNARTEIRRVSGSASDSDDSMTESEEENWGIIAGSKINADQPAAVSHRNLNAPEVDDESTDSDRRESSRPITGERDKSGDSTAKEQENIRMRKSCSEIEDKARSDLSLDSRALERQGEVEILSPSRRREAENNNKEKRGGNDRREDEIIINADSAESSFGEKIGGEESARRISENRKRPIASDSGKKSKQQNSPKKARSSEDWREAGSSSSLQKSPRENKENKDKQRNCAADYFFTPMNDEMENYYNKSWGGENFDIDEIRRQMPRDQRHWAILNEDALGYQQRRSRYWVETKCKNCHHTGHKIAECPEKRKVPSCHMCGTPGHREPRCPHKMCLGCGKKQRTYMQVCNGCRKAWCDGCQSYGHVEESCPDHWRRYHVTTSHSEVNTQLSVEDVMKPQHLLSCCNCAKRGHDSTTCDNYRWSRHFPTPAYVSNYTSGPAYPEDAVCEEAREENQTEKRATDSDAAPKSSSSSEGRKRRSNADQATSVSHETGEILQSGSKEVDKNREEAKEKTQRSRELLPAISRPKEGGEVLLTLESQLLDAEFTQAANFGECVVPLFVHQYEELTNSDLSRNFLENLVSQFPVKLEIKRSTIGELTMTIASTKDLHHPIQVTVMDWLKWPLDERSRFVSLNLPTKKEDLMKLLDSKLKELKEDLGNPFHLIECIKKQKIELQRLQTQSMAGTKSSTSSERARVVQQLATAQCRLNMIFFGQVKLRKTEKSCKFLENALREMQRVGSDSFVCASVYLLVVHHYNVIFSAYTPDHLNNLLDLYWQQFSHPGARKDKIRSWNKAHINLIKNVKNLGEKRRAKLPLMVKSPGQILSQNLVGAALSRTSVESKFPPRKARSSVASLSPKPKPKQKQKPIPPLLPTPQFPLIYDLDRLENNYYNSQYNFGDSSRHQRHRGGAQGNRQQEDYAALENRNLQNNHYNVERDCGNAGSDFRAKLRSHWAERGGTRTRVQKAIENGFQKNFSGENVQGGNSLMVKNRWQDGFPPRNPFSQDIFFSDAKAEASQNYIRNEVSDPSSRNEFEMRGGGPSTSGMQNQPRIHFDNNNPTSSGPEQRNRIAGVGNKNKNKKKKKSKDSVRDRIVRRRAKKHIAKYINSECPQLTEAAQELRRKFNRKDLALQDVQEFDLLVRRKLKKSEHLF